jgi:hypothetical protein
VRAPLAAGTVALVLVLTALVLPGRASASAYKCTNVITTMMQCIDVRGSSLTVDSIRGEFWLAFAQVAQGKYKQALRITRPSGSVRWVWSPQTKLGCKASMFGEYLLCWRYRFEGVAGSYPDGTELCTATFEEGNGSRTRITGWACAEVQR